MEKTSRPTRPPKTRAEVLKALAPDQPAYRVKQIMHALYEGKAEGWNDITTLPKALREQMTAEIPWISVTEKRVLKSARGDTYKAILSGYDGHLFETVLMENARDQWTICVSSQVGCAMGCTFCATGAMGLKRSLSADEIADQYRFWKIFLAKQSELPQRISNVVFMGMGEPMANYENVKAAIHAWLDNTDIGPTHITVSSVGVLFQLEKLLSDPDWPPVRIAISLHSANQKRREEIVPTTTPTFLEDLTQWTRKYWQTLGNRRHHITFEYTLISGVNDSPELAKELGAYVSKTPFSKINVIPFNPVVGKTMTRSSGENIEKFKNILRSYNLDVTQRRTMGDDIAAACGQLVTEEKGRSPLSLDIE